jgi:hypothetical protein
MNRRLERQTNVAHAPMNLLLVQDKDDTNLASSGSSQTRTLLHVENPKTKRLTVLTRYQYRRTSGPGALGLGQEVAGAGWRRRSLPSGADFLFH